MNVLSVIYILFGFNVLLILLGFVQLCSDEHNHRKGFLMFKVLSLVAFVVIIKIRFPLILFFWCVCVWGV